MFVPGSTYNRRNLHAKYGGQAQGGICTPARHPFIMLFTGESGTAYGYHDGWTPEGVFQYTGEGQRGDMSFVRGNRAIRDHEKDGKDLYLFEQAGRGRVRYIGQMFCAGYHERPGPDVAGSQRKIIVFELVPTEFLAETAEPPEQDPKRFAEDRLWSMAFAELRRLAVGVGTRPVTIRERTAVARIRSQAVRVYVLRRANDTCEGCGNPAPFVTPTGHAYLEPHHIRRLTDGGADDPISVAAVCPNCHRRAHHANDASTFNPAYTPGKLSGWATTRFDRQRRSSHPTGFSLSDAAKKC
jgi:5-methylcytosine-specific restriction enzyme A